MSEMLFIPGRSYSDSPIIPIIAGLVWFTVYVRRAVMFVTQHEESFGTVLDYCSYPFVQRIVKMSHLQRNDFQTLKTENKV